MMYDHSEIHYFDPHSIQIGVPAAVAAEAMDFQLDQKFSDARLKQEVIVIEDEPSPVQSSHQDLYQEMQEMQERNTTHYHQQEQLYDQQQIELQHLSNGGVLGSSSTILPNFSWEIFGESTSYDNEVIHGGENGSGFADNLYEQHNPISLHLNNLPPQPAPIFRQLFETSPQNYGVSSSLFGNEMDDETKEVYQHEYGADNNGIRQFENLVPDFKREMNTSIHGVGGNRGRSSTNGLGIASHGNKHITSTEKMKREKLGDQFKALSLLVPSPSKPDRASVLASTIDYINELKGTVDSLKVLVDKKRNARNKKLKNENGDMEGSAAIPTSNTNTDRDKNSLNGQVRSSWSQRKSKDAEVDVRTIDGDITIQLIIQRAKMINLLLSVSRIFDELQLDLLHVSSGYVGDYCSFWFNTKILEGSPVYASAIASKIIEGVEKTMQHS